MASKEHGDVSEERAEELKILEAAKELAKYENGSLRFGLGRLSVGRNDLRGDDNLHKITDGARRLVELSSADDSQLADAPA